MRLKTDDLREVLTIDIRGDEAWLKDIYASFGQKEGDSSAKISGRLTVTPSDYGVFYVRGQILFTPFVHCGRCEDMIPWEIDRRLDARFLTPYDAGDEEEAEKDLTPEDLDDYYIEGKEINIEPLVNDLIQTALPSRLIRTTADGKACAICLEDVQVPLVFEQQSAEDASPFAVLKNLKLPEN